MGNNESKPTQQFLNDLAEFKKVDTRPDYRVGDIAIWQRIKPQPTNELLLVKEKWSMNKYEFQKYKARLQRRQGVNHPNLCALRALSFKEDSQWCSKYYKTHAAIEYYQENLAEELKRRQRIPGDDVVNKVQFFLWVYLKRIFWMNFPFSL